MSYILLSESKPKAKKPHRCIWCGESINIGEVYIREKSIYDSNFQDHKWHIECLDDCNEAHKGECEWDFDPYENERPKKQ